MLPSSKRFDESAYHSYIASQEAGIFSHLLTQVLAGMREPQAQARDVALTARVTFPTTDVSREILLLLFLRRPLCCGDWFRLWYPSLWGHVRATVSLSFGRCSSWRHCASGLAHYNLRFPVRI